MRIKKVDFYQLIKFLLIISSFILLSFILNHVLTSKVDYFGRERTYTIELVIISLLIALIFLVSIFEVLTLKEYKGYIIKRPLIKKGSSYLTLTDIFDNENRLNILREILNNPGIHQNELLRRCDLQKGQLQWHLDVLLKNHIIKKEKYGQYTIYFPITASIESIENFKNLPSKSETTENVLDIIQKNPGINSSKISRILNLSRNTIKYHIDKLSENDLINLKEKGRKIELYPNI
ncbi:MAG: winged helix-turn-helix transcriptional regulator [Candidatus Lokiarchaeota archaeon]|nr:winged helix-turn-helix transcriptional regulator [Candidatus Lokiarchaeota archaeon]